MSKQFKARCSGIIDIMAAATAGRLIPVGAETVVKKWYLGEYFGKKPTEQHSKYTTKGKECEWEAVGELMQIDGIYCDKNTQTFENEFLIGTPDLLRDDKIIDIKCPFDYSTFPLFDKELNRQYWWQMQGYMALTGYELAEVVYILMDLPEQIVETLARDKARAENVLVTEDMKAEIRENGKYSHLPTEKRIKRFEVQRDEAAINRICQRVQDCREWLANLI